jgi:beta-N-acetylhexosaminidase
VFAVALVALAGCGDRGGRETVPNTTAGTASPSTAATTSPSTSTKSTAPSTAAPSTTAPSGCTSRAAIDAWPVAQRAAQLIALPSLDFDVAGLTPLIRNGTGGILFLGSASAPSDLRARLTAAAGAYPQAFPLVMADVEGGGVQRLQGPVDAFPWPRELAATMSVDQVRALALRVGSQMKNLGVTVNLAPVLDLDDRAGPNATNPDGERSFSLDPAITSEYGIAFMRGLQAAHVLPVVKHFPGIGLSIANTDFGPAATRPIGELRASGLQPFAKAIAAGAPAVMISNASTPGLTTTPGAVSPAVIEGLLRRELGFHGLVVTDSLSAGAIASAGYTVPEAALAAIRAGADLVLFGSTLTPADVAKLSPGNVAMTRQAIIDKLVKGVRDGGLSPDRLNDAVAHVLAAKGVKLCDS